MVDGLLIVLLEPTWFGLASSARAFPGCESPVLSWALDADALRMPRVGLKVVSLSLGSRA